MSEYTNYFFVKSGDTDHIYHTLKKANIAAQLGLLKNSQTGPWTVIVSKTTLDQLERIFPICGAIFVGEGPSQWKLILWVNPCSSVM
jgi:hypothetical protein